MKKIAVIFFLTIIGLNIIGFFPLFKILQYQIRQEVKIKIKKRLAEKEMYKISFSERDKIDWIQAGVEFRYHNQMFDIVKQEKENGRMVYWCINDKEESQLFANLDTLVKQQMNNDESTLGNVAKLLIEIFLLLYFAEKPCDLTLTTKEKEIYSYYYQFILSSGYINIITPPPKRLV